MIVLLIYRFKGKVKGDTRNPNDSRREDINKQTNEKGS